MFGYSTIHSLPYYSFTNITTTVYMKVYFNLYKDSSVTYKDKLFVVLCGLDMWLLNMYKIPYLNTA